jgi:glycosyltransferase involved in cell wall biosynthesis
MRRAARFGLEHADPVCVGSPDLRESVEAVAEPHRLELVPYGVPVDEFTPGEIEPQEGVLTVAGMDEDSIRRKGIDEVVEGAREMPDGPFDLVGDAQDEAAEELVASAPENVIHHGRLTGEPLLERFREANVHAQLSWLEGFGVSLAEGMACGNIPVVSDRPAHSWVAGDTGWTVPYREPEAAAEAIQEAFDAPTEAGERARERVVERFTLEDRIDRLAELLADLARGAP